jgi:hypothetical protein
MYFFLTSVKQVQSAERQYIYDTYMMIHVVYVVSGAPSRGVVDMSVGDLGPAIWMSMYLLVLHCRHPTYISLLFVLLSVVSQISAIV